MQDAKKIKENLENLIQNLDPSSWAKNPNDFTRNRKLGFNKLLHVMLGMRGNSINKELTSKFSKSDEILNFLKSINNGKYNFNSVLQINKKDSDIL